MSGLITTIGLKSGPSGSCSPLIFRTGTVTVFVGPNHSGKSLLLQEIRNAIPNPKGTSFSKLLDKLEFNAFDVATHQKVESEIRQHCRDHNANGKRSVILTHAGIQQIIDLNQFDANLARTRTIEGLRAQFGSLGMKLANSFGLLLNGNERLKLLVETPRENLRGEAAQTLGILFQNDAKRAELQRVVHQAFGWYLVVDVTGHDKFRAAVSEIQPPVGVERNLNNEALEFFRQCADISTMSDGVRSYCGMVASVIASEAKVLLIDEPEAFLHPALCTSLAKELCRKAHDNGRQLIVATHSAPFLLGCMQAAVDLNVVRLTFRNASATSRIMEHQELVPLMRNPLLRSIGALNGIFFESVVVTEAATDRAFYEEVNNRCLQFTQDGGIQDCLFLNAQNWQTTRIIGPLRKLGIAAAAVVDVDIILEEAGASFQKLLEAAGIPEPTRAALGQMRGRLRPKTDDDSKSLKLRGVESLSGESRQALEDFIEQLASYGVFVVPCGELESWLPNLSRTSTNKTVWLESTFEAMGEDAALEGYVKPGTGDVWSFLSKIRRWLHDPNRRGIPVS